MLRADNPLAKEALTLAAYAAAEHITVSRRSRLRDPIGDALLTSGLQDVVAAFTAMQLVRHGDFVTVVAERANRRLLDDLGSPHCACLWRCLTSRCTSRGTSATTATTHTSGCARRSWPSCGRCRVRRSEEAGVPASLVIHGEEALDP